MNTISIFLFIILYLIILVAEIITIISTWLIYQKANVAGWKSLIPFYSSYVLITKIAKLNWWWFLIANCSIITFPSIILIGTESINKIINLTYILTIFGAFVCYYNVAKKFHRSTFEAILMMIIPVIMYPIIAFSKNCNYDHELIVSKNGPFKEYNEDEE